MGSAFQSLHDLGNRDELWDRVREFGRENFSPIKMVKITHLFQTVSSMLS